MKPGFAVVRRSDLAVANLWYKKRSPIRFETAGLSISLSPGVPDDGRHHEPEKRVNFSAGGLVASLAVPESLISKIVESYGLPSGHKPRDPVLSLLLEHRFAPAFEALERHLDCSIALSNPDLDHRLDGPGFVCLAAGIKLWDSEFHITLSLPAALAGRLIHLAAPSAGTQQSGMDVPVEVAHRIGASLLTLKLLKSVRLGDVILADTAAGEHMCVITFGEQLLARGRWENGRVSLLERPIKRSHEYREVWSMSNAANSGGSPSATDAELNDIQIKVVFELGRQEIRFGDLRSLAPGFVFDLSRDQRTAVDIYAGTQRIGVGEVVQVSETLGVRVIRLFNNE